MTASYYRTTSGREPATSTAAGLQGHSATSMVSAAVGAVVPDRTCMAPVPLFARCTDTRPAVYICRQAREGLDSLPYSRAFDIDTSPSLWRTEGSFSSRRASCHLNRVTTSSHSKLTCTAPATRSTEKCDFDGWNAPRHVYIVRPYGCHAKHNRRVLLPSVGRHL